MSVPNISKFLSETNFSDPSVSPWPIEMSARELVEVKVADPLRGRDSSGSSSRQPCSRLFFSPIFCFFCAMLRSDHDGTEELSGRGRVLESQRRGEARGTERERKRDRRE